MSHVPLSPSPANPTLPRLRARAAALLRHQGAAAMLAAVCIAAAVRYDSFATPENFLNVLRQNSMAGLLALGMTCVILTGGIDLSVGALLGVGGAVGAALSPWGAAVAVPGAVAATGLLGLGNGVVVAKARVQPFIATLVISLAARGVLLAATGEQSVRVDRAAAAFFWLGRGWAGPVPVPILILLACYALGWGFLAHTRFGRHVYAVGDNAEAARLMGLNVDRVLIGAYALSGALAGLAGVVLAARLGVGQPMAGNGWELNVITAVVIGGTSLGGGQGSLPGTLVGLILLAVVFNIFNLEGGLNSYWQWVLRGVFLLLVVTVQNRLNAVGGASSS